MQSFIGISHFLLALLLQRVPAQTSHPPDKTYSDFVPLQEVLLKSMCRPMEQLVDVEQEVGYIYIPACVPLLRCAGCCQDEGLECQPALERNITLQVMRVNPMVSSQCVKLAFVEHQTCECRVRQHLLNNISAVSIRNRTRERRRKKTANGCSKCQFPQNKINLR